MTGCDEAAAGGCNSRDMAVIGVCEAKPVSPLKPDSDWLCSYWLYPMMLFDARHHSPRPNVCPVAP